MQTMKQAFGVIETIQNPTREKVDAVIEALKDHADSLLDWWELERIKRDCPEGVINGIEIITNEAIGGHTTVALKYYFYSLRFREVRAFIKYQAENAPKWHYDAI